jgi:hypothetical protein
VRRLALLLALAACGPRSAPGPAPGPAPKPAPDAGVSSPDAPLPLQDDPPTLAARIADMIDALATALDEPTSCAALATRARDVLDEHRAVRDAATEAARRGREREVDAALEAHAERIAGAVAKMRPALTACGGDATFAEAITPFDL